MSPELGPVRRPTKCQAEANASGLCDDPRWLSGPAGAGSAIFGREAGVGRAPTAGEAHSGHYAPMPCLAVGIASETCRPEALAGGDFADVVPLSGGRVALVLGSVCGGPSAALCVPPVLYALRLTLRDCPHPAHALARLNRHLCAWNQPTPGPPVTLSLAVVDAGTGEALCACAGSDPPLILRAGGGVETAGAGRAALGMDAGREFRAVDFRLGSGDALLLATDGITEAGRTSGAGSGDLLRYGELAGLAVDAFTAGGPPERVARAVLDGARALVGSVTQDDVCVLVATRR